MSSLSEVIREAYALSKSDEVILETIELRWRDSRILLVSNFDGIAAKLETGENAFFTAAAVVFSLPAKNERGFQELNISISNIDQQASDFLQQTLEYDDEITCIYRPYMASRLSIGPEMNPPLELTLSGAEVTIDQVNATATFVDILNRGFLTKRYTKSSNPSL